MKLRGNSEHSACCLLAKGLLNQERLISKLYQVVQALVYFSFEASQQEFLRALWALVPVLKKFITAEVVTLRFPLLRFMTIVSCPFDVLLEQMKLVLLWVRGCELQGSQRTNTYSSVILLKWGKEHITSDHATNLCSSREHTSSNFKLLLHWELGLLFWQNNMSLMSLVHEYSWRNNKKLFVLTCKKP